MPLTRWKDRCARAQLRDERGFTITELMVALMILSVAFFALAGSASIGFRIGAEGREREAATEIANGRLEHLRDIPYTDLALNTAPTHSTDTNNPDYFVSNNGSQFNPGTGTYEDLDLD